MLPVFDYTIDDTNGVFNMSLVEEAAVDVDFQFFEKQKPADVFADEAQHIVYGVAMRPDYLIYRNDARLGKCFFRFSKDTVKQCAQQFLRDMHNTDVTLNHEMGTDGVYLIYSFIKDVENGVNPKGFEEIEDGAWFVGYKVENDEVWKKVLNGDFKGFSIEIHGNLELEVTDETEEYIKSLLN